MNRQFIILLLVAAFLLPHSVLAAPDYYYGDSAIYVGGQTSSVKPNILFFIDTSKQMSEAGTSGTYVRSATDWPDTGYDTGTIYYKSSDTYKATSTNMPEVYTGYLAAYNALYSNGNIIGCIDSKGEQCTNKTEDYYTGDYLNWKGSVGTASQWSSSTTYAVGDLVYKAGDLSTSQQYKCIAAGESGASDPFPAADSVDVSTTYADNSVTWQPQVSLIKLLEYELNNNIFPYLAPLANVGLMEYNSNDQGGAITIPVADNTAAQLAASMTADIVPITQTANAQPLGGALWDAWLYWVGDPAGTLHANSTANDNAAYTPSPIEYWCQNNHMVVLATGASKDNLGTSNPIAAMDKDGDLGVSHIDDYYAPESAHYLYNSLDLEVDEVQAKVNTHIIQLMTPQIQQLIDTAAYGHGTYLNVSESSEIYDALVQIIMAILEEDTSFVAPVVPASPENRTYSGQRIYLGFFKPMNDEPWYGNLKKFGLSNDNQIVAYDSSGDLVSATDTSGYFLVDDSTDPPTPTNRSFWTPSGTADGGLVDSGGVGGLLKARSSARDIYTYLGSESNLYDSVNAFTTSNSSLTSTVLDVADDAAKNEVINFVHGYEADGTTKRNWILGDILHSKPLIVNYANYVFSETNEADSSKNKSLIFFGGNDGMLHAVNDHNGQEAWAFIPPELLDDLQHLMDTEYHYYFVDNSPLAYVHDADGDGTIETGDKVILLFGLRRGGGSSTLVPPAVSGDPPPSRGSYYAIDISDPTEPKYLWSINSETTGFGEMGETWSQPRLTKMNIGGVSKLVAVFGAGYDNNEDLRYGNTQAFPPGTDASTNVSAASDGFASGASSGGGSQYEPRGRGLYVVEVAQLNESSGVHTPDFTNSGSLVWSATYDASDSVKSAMTFSMPSDVLVYDQDHDSYADHFYVVDTGGQLWRFNVSNASTGNWTVKKIFESNTGTANVGRKVFYKPTVTYSYPDTFIYFGTGDREHPLNYLNPATNGGAVLDRFYMVRDREVEVDPDLPAYLTESNLVDVTDNELQRDDSTTTEVDALIDKLYNFSPTEEDGSDRTVYYGWRIDLDANDGEKVLAPPTVFADVAFFTTYTPNSASSVASDPCSGGNLGVSRLYAVKARTGEAVYNWWTTDGTDDFGENQSTATSKRAQAGPDDSPYVLRRADRSLAIGEGIPSGLVVVIGKDGSTSILIGSGGAFPNVELDQIETVYPLYWMNW
jgi:type IV pilus assembly protein PilY1